MNRQALSICISIRLEDFSNQLNLRRVKRRVVALFWLRWLHRLLIKLILRLQRLCCLRCHPYRPIFNPVIGNGRLTSLVTIHNFRNTILNMEKVTGCKILVIFSNSCNSISIVWNDSLKSFYLQKRNEQNYLDMFRCLSLINNSFLGF